jgi:hypothetical protein
MTFLELFIFRLLRLDLLVNMLELAALCASNLMCIDSIVLRLT